MDTKTGDALGSFVAGIRDNSRYAGAHYHSGLALAHLDRTAEALSEFEAAVRLQPDHTNPMSRLGIVPNAFAPTLSCSANLPIVPLFP